MGYLFPGIIALFFIQLMWDGNDNSIYNILNITTFEEITKKVDQSINLETSVICVVFAYVIGHIISYISSVTVEYFANKTFGYPSEYLMDSNGQKWWKLVSRYFFNLDNDKLQMHERIKHILLQIITGRFICRLIISTILFPISFMTFVLGNCFGINSFITRPLDYYLIEGIKCKYQKLMLNLEIKPQKVDVKCDYHRIIMHYVYYNLPICQNKTDNYISLYGFLRSICLIMNGMFLFITLKIIPTLDINASFDEKKVWTWSILFILSYISFLAFVKFYRRFTLENYMIMLTEKINIHRDEKTK